jgi:integrase
MGARKRKRRDEPENLYERAGIFYARVTVGGNEHRRSLKTRDREEAERRLTAWLAGLSPYHGTVRHSFKEAAALWLTAGEWKPKTLAGYIKLLNVLDEYFGGMFWDQVDKAALQAFASERRTKGSGTATINRYLSVMSGIADHVRELPGWPEINPVRLLPRKPRKETRLPYVRPPARDIDSIFERMRGTFGDLCRAALLCGARKDELVYLKRDDAKDGRATFMDTKSHLPRTISWATEARTIVERQPVIRESPYVFNTRNRGPYKRVTEMWREVVLRAQNTAQKSGSAITRMRFHDLRHEYAIRYLESGGSLYRLQRDLGHGSIRQTERYLVYLTPEQAAIVSGGTAQNTAQ